MMVSETIRLSAHEKFIIDGIKRQAGSVEKAVLELVMNAIEAQQANNKKPVVNIDFTCDEDGSNPKLVVRDMGRGFKNRNEIEQWFAKFGTPHDECPECKKTMKLQGNMFECVCGYKTEGRTWAEFRMGRGQAFSFGRNVWRTGTFRMEYDLETDPDERTYAHKDETENHVLDFSLQSNLPNQKGCEVTVYFYNNPIGHGYRSLDDFKSKIKHHVEFMEGEITFNGEQVNTPASECNWDIETEDAYFMFGRGNKLALYNIGAYVNDHSASDMGVTGVVVSKSKMMVNFARNDVMQSCKVWQRVRIIIRENRIKRVRRASRRLNDDERISTLLDLRDGDCEYNEIKSISLVELTNGKVMALGAIRKIRSPWTIADPGDRVADHLMQVDEAICFSQETIDALDYCGDPGKFFDWLLKVHFDGEKTNDYGWRQESKSEKAWAKVTAFYRSFTGTKGLASGYTDCHRILPVDKLSKAERRFLKVMEDFGKWKGRTLCIGISDTANGWTDGKTYIAFNRAYLKHHNPSYYGGSAALVTLAFHEMAHDTDDTGTHLHSVEFYEKYHDLTRGESLWLIGSLSGKMSSQKWQDQAEEIAEKEAKKKAQRDKALGIKRVVKGQKVAADTSGLIHKPKPKRVAKKKKSRRRMRF